MSAVLAVIAYVGICVLWLGIGLWIGGSPERKRRRSRRQGEVRENSQLEVTGIHHIDPSDEITKPHRRSRHDKDRDGHS